MSRALQVWLLSNLGGTSWLLIGFGVENSTADLVIPLLIGLMAALISLVCLPVVFLFLTLAHRTCTSWRCRLVAATGVLLVFALENLLVLYWLPVGPVGSLLSLSRPYLGAAILAVAWLYAPRMARAKPAPAARLLSIWWRPPVRATLAR